jgi:hypothetical protein
VPSRILVGKAKYFSLPIKAYRDKSILGSKYTSVSLCGGHGLIDMDTKLKKLPIGLYINEDLVKESNIHNKRLIKTSDDLVFIKQEDESINFYMNFSRGDVTLRKLVADLLARSLIKDDKARRKWDLWISAHEGSLDFIKKEN